MPEFQLDTGGQCAEFDQLPRVARGYIEALFFTNSGDRDDELTGKTFADIAPETLARIIADCAKFESENAKDCADCGLDDMQIGRDIWFTRCGHGVGFWDRGIGEYGDRLSEAARKLGNVDPYAGDDGKVYLCP